jgi:N-methylhydantoinase B/oxoprolinase/acetone carboxylase alpha subunit
VCVSSSLCHEDLTEFQLHFVLSSVYVVYPQVKFSLAQGLDDIGTVSAKDYLDDGTCIQLAVTIDRTKKCAVFDFTGTGPEVIHSYILPL